MVTGYSLFLPQTRTKETTTTGDPEPQDETATLLHALQMKAAAFSDSAWQAHWNRTAPWLLARGWASLYPHIPLAEVERATGVGFLVAAVRRENGEDVMSDLVRATQTLDITTDNCESVAMETANQEASCDKSHDPQAITDEEIQRLWGELYNSYYWYCYQSWVEGEGKREGEGEVILVTPLLVMGGLYYHIWCVRIKFSFSCRKENLRERMKDVKREAVRKGRERGEVRDVRKERGRGEVRGVRN